MKLLLTAIGKRVQLIKHLKENFEIIGVDAGELIPARKFVNHFYKVPKYCEDNYIKELINVCKIEKVDLIIPLYEKEFQLLSDNRTLFSEVGTKLILSNTEIIKITNDKSQSYNFLKENNILIPKCYSKEEIDGFIKKRCDEIFPLIIKPVDGMGSSNVFKINNFKELEFFRDYIKNNVIQDFIVGNEFTVDVLCDFSGNPVFIVPRKRLEVRSGEVTKTASVHDESIINETKKVLEIFNLLRDKRGLGIMGPITIQFFKTEDGKIYFIEMNPRFGGGVPLTFKAGANYGKAIYNAMKGEKLEYNSNFREITMLRYDEAVFLE